MSSLRRWAVGPLFPPDESERRPLDRHLISGFDDSVGAGGHPNL
jgi:hypothetical protein